MRFYNQCLIVSSLAFTLCGLSAQADQHDNNTNPDITVLKAWSSGIVDLNGAETSIQLNASLCSSSVDSSTLIRDCAGAVQAALKGPNDSHSSAIASRFDLSPDKTADGKPFEANFCPVFTVQAALKVADVNSPIFTGVGFSVQVQRLFSGGLSPSYGAFTPKSELFPINQVKLKDGSIANVYQFIAAGLCDSQNTDGAIAQSSTVAFKPYAQYQLGDQTWNNWDVVSDNYQIQGDRAGSFDRSQDVLDPSSIAPPTPAPVFTLNTICSQADGGNGIWLTEGTDGAYKVNTFSTTNISKDHNTLNLNGRNGSETFNLLLDLTAKTGRFTSTPLSGQPGIPQVTVIAKCTPVT